MLQQCRQADTVKLFPAVCKSNRNDVHMGGQCLPTKFKQDMAHARGTLGDTKKARVPYPLAFLRDNMQKSNCSTCKRSILLRSHTCLTTVHGMALPLCQIGQERKLCSSLPSVHWGKTSRCTRIYPPSGHHRWSHCTLHATSFIGVNMYADSFTHDEGNTKRLAWQDLSKTFCISNSAAITRRAIIKWMHADANSTASPMF